jgi:hypothetical protein
MTRARLLLLVTVALAACHGTRPDTPLSPVASCQHCCSQALDACKLDTDAFPMARCPPRFQECVAACNAGDENEMCVVQTNRDLLASALRQSAPTAPAAQARAVPEQRGECDNKGMWQLAVAQTHGEARGCRPLDELPPTVSFRVGRRRDGFVLYDLAPAPGWTDSFTIENGEHDCRVVLRRENRSAPRTLTVQLTDHDRAISGELQYREPNESAPCALMAPVTGRVVPPPPEAPSPPLLVPRPPPREPPPSTASGRGRP